MKIMKGIIPVLVSPMNQDGSPDEQGYRKLVEFTMKYPIGGYWILGSASEDFLMSHDDRVLATKIIAESVDGKIPIIAGCGQPVLKEMYKFFDDTANMKIDAYHLLPTDRKMNASLTYRYCTMIADRAPKPLWLYNNEKRGLKIPVEAVRDLKDHPNIAGIKAAGYDLSDILPFCLMNDGENFQTIGSGGGHLLVFLVHGCTAHTISPACCFPKEYCRAYDLWQEGKIDEAREQAFAISRIIKALPHPENTEFSAEEKIVMEILGVCKRYVHPPFVSCTDAEEIQARKVLQEAGIL